MAMSTDPSGETDWATRWNRVFELLSAEPRREVIRSLLNEPRRRRLPLPEAADSLNQSMGSGVLATKLRHHHLPKLADFGYIRWENDPFCVQRGPNFEELAFVVGNILDSLDEIPSSLVNNCKVLRRMVDDEPS